MSDDTAKRHQTQKAQEQQDKAVAGSAPATQEQAARGPFHDPLKQRAYGLWLRQWQPNPRADETWPQGQAKAAKGESPRGRGETPREDTSGAVAPPKERGLPGAAADLGGTPSAAALGPGRQAD